MFIMKHIPNLITSLNMVSGFIAIISAARGDVLLASWFIVAAMIFDFLDGFAARLLGAYSDIGKELDSLADVVSFGVAPAIIIFELLNSTISDYFLIRERIFHSIVMFIPSIMPVCAALRLAIFNTDPSQSTSFRGLPTPANAFAVITLAFAANYSDQALSKTFIDTPLILLIYTVILSLLMISRIHLFSLKIKNLNFPGNEGRYLLVFILLLNWIILGPLSLLLVIPMYILASVFHYGLKTNKSE